jgi:hypothetical protein
MDVLLRSRMSTTIRSPIMGVLRRVIRRVCRVRLSIIRMRMGGGIMRIGRDNMCVLLSLSHRVFEGIWIEMVELMGAG